MAAQIFITLFLRVMNVIKSIAVCMLLLSATLRIAGQVRPSEGSLLNYRIIAFSVPQQHWGKYGVEVAVGDWKDEQEFKRNQIISVSAAGSKIIAEVPSWGKTYTWRTTCSLKDGSAVKGELHHFSVGVVRECDTNVSRLRVLQEARKYGDAYVFLDANKALYDMRGNMVWYMPEIRELKQAAVRDLKVTSQGTITFVIDEVGAYEMSYDGRILWKAPNDGQISGDSVEHYHHEFTRLENGNYMALAQEFKTCKQSIGDDTVISFVDDMHHNPGTGYSKLPMGTLIEYNPCGKIIWSWKLSAHFEGTGFFYRRQGTGGLLMRPHENSFFFDKDSGVVYLSCRNLSRIIKIKYPEGNVLAVYGNVTDIYSRKSEVDYSYALFCGQHSCRLSHERYLLLFDNNMCNPGEPPAAVMIKEPLQLGDSCKKIWEYRCATEGAVKQYPSGGNVFELPDTSLFVSTAYPGSDLFIVTRGKKILWHARAETMNPSTHLWEPVNLFRASIIINKHTIEKLICGAE